MRRRLVEGFEVSTEVGTNESTSEGLTTCGRSKNNNQVKKPRKNGEIVSKEAVEG